MTNENNNAKNSEHGAFGRPGFIAAALVVVLIAVLGIVVGVTNVLRDDPAPESASAVSTTLAPTPFASPEPPASNEDSASTSVCGLTGEVTERARLAKAPDVDYWDYQGSAAYPVSAQYGPAATADAGYRYCFQRSPEGAVYAAAYASIIGADPDVARQFLDYFIAPGPYRDQQLSEDLSEDDGSAETGRLRIAGFRLLSYDGNEAKVDVAVAVSLQGQSFYMSVIAPLVWSEGDWKLPSDAEDVGSAERIPDITGYISWSQ
ncbi:MULTISPECIES: hypothetical protein [unclassified Actinomyces]|uniref:hypothetical protein n=1 Tax=unclassified Actinomyces TaxID=2609248 RepID=UPI00137B33F8|nr:MULTISPECIES: hypothetical protein [unclassified Actinomyces]NDR53548.1 hypothetical protein [Actinomyces sp. 565]